MYDCSCEILTRSVKDQLDGEGEKLCLKYTWLLPDYCLHYMLYLRYEYLLNSSSSSMAEGKYEVFARHDDRRDDRPDGLL